MNNEYENSSQNIKLPIFLGIVLAIGFLLGYFYNKKTLIPQNNSQNKIDEVQSLIQRYYFDTIDNEKLIDDGIKNLLSCLDPHSSYMNKKESQQFQTSMSGGFEGIGVQFNLLNDTLIVVGVIVGGPSAQQGILAGDKIISVDDTTIAGVGIQNNDIIQKLRGKKGTKVKLGIVRQDIKEPIYFVVTRDKIPVNSINYSCLIAPKIGYINIDNFTLTTAYEFDTILNNLLKKGMEKLIIDLRGNSGGYLGAVISICDELLPSKKMIVYTKGMNYPIQKYRATSRGQFQEEKQKVVVLIDEYSASASEILAGAIQDHDRGTVIGRRSFGKGLVQTQFFLSDSSEVLLTIARYYTPLGRCIQRPFKNGNNAYFNDILNRYSSGELQTEDSVFFDESLKVTTPAGKVLYGGGGIMPDIFIPIKTSNDFVYFNQLANSGIVLQYAMQYANNNRKTLINKYKTAENFVKFFNINDEILQTIISKGKEKSIKGTLTPTTKKELQQWTKAYIGRNLFGDNAFYPILFQDDNMILEAIKVLNQ